MTEVKDVWVSVEVYEDGSIFAGAFKTEASALEDMTSSIEDIGGNTEDIDRMLGRYRYSSGGHEFFVQRTKLLD